MHIEQIIAWSIMVILIFKDYIKIKKPYKYIVIALTILAIIVQTPLADFIHLSLWYSGQKTQDSCLVFFVSFFNPENTMFISWRNF